MLKLFNKIILVGVLSVLAGCATQKFSTGDPSPATVIQPAAIVKDYSDYAALGLVNVDADFQNKFALALHAIKKKQASKAETQLDELISQRPDLVTPLYNRAVLAQSESQMELAFELFAKAHFIDPANTLVCNAYGRALRLEGEFQKAKAVYETCLSFEDQSPVVHKNYGILLDLYLQTPQIALKQYQAYLSKTPVEDRRVKGWVVDLERRLQAKEAQR